MQRLRDLFEIPRFEDPATEAAFQEKFVEGSITFSIFSSAAVSMAVPLLVALNTTTSVRPSLESQVARLLVLLIFLLMLYLCLKQRKWLKNNYELIIFSLLSIAFLFMTLATKYGGLTDGALYWSYNFNYIGSIIAASVFSRLRVTTLLALMAWGVFVTATATWSLPIDIKLFARFVVFSFTFTVAGVLGRTAFEVVERKLFAESNALTRARALLAQSLQQEEQLVAQRTRLLAAIGHDLRQPLTAIKALLYVMQTHAGAESQTAQHLVNANKCVDDIDLRLGQISELAKQQTPSARAALKPTHPQRLFDRLQAVYGLRAANSGIELRLLIPSAGNSALVFTAEEQLFSVLGQLVDNAIKYADNKKAKRVIAVRIRAAGSKVKLYVVDNGIGISKSLLPTLPFPYIQGKKGRGGLGLGLSLAYSTLRAMSDHALLIRSKERWGTVAIITAPKAQRDIWSEEGENFSPALMCEERLNLTVLLVDDYHAGRQAIAAALESAGCHVLQASSYLEACNLARSCELTIDVIATDYHLPDGKTGIDVITFVRESEEFLVKSVVFSGDDTEFKQHAASDVSFLTKPVDPLRLIRALS